MDPFFFNFLNYEKLAKLVQFALEKFKKDTFFFNFLIYKNLENFFPKKLAKLVQFALLAKFKNGPFFQPYLSVYIQTRVIVLVLLIIYRGCSIGLCVVGVLEKKNVMANEIAGFCSLNLLFFSFF